MKMAEVGSLSKSELGIRKSEVTFPAMGRGDFVSPAFA